VYYNNIKKKRKGGRTAEVGFMKKSNVEIAKMVAERGYDYQKTLDGIDAGRTPEEEELDISEEELQDMIDNICSSFEQEKDFASDDV